MDKIQLTSWDGDIHVLYTYMSYIYYYLIWFAASFIAWKCLLCWWEPSNKLEGLHCSALTFSKTHSTTTQGLGHKFGHWGLLSHLSRFLVGKYQAKQKKHWRLEGNPMKETNIGKRYHNPATWTKRTTVCKHTLRSSWSSYITLKDPRNFWKKGGFSVTIDLNYQV